MSDGVKFSIRAAHVRMGVWLQMNFKHNKSIRVTGAGRGGPQEPCPGARYPRGQSSHSGRTGADPTLSGRAGTLKAQHTPRQDSAHGILTMLVMAEVNTSRTEAMPTAVLCALDRTMLRLRRCSPSGNRWGQQDMEVWKSVSQGGKPRRGGKGWLLPPSLPPSLPAPPPGQEALHPIPGRTEPQVWLAQMNTAMSSNRKILA